MIDSKRSLTNNFDMIRKMILLFTLCPSFLYAQFSRGQIYSSGSLSLSKGSQDYSTSQYLNQTNANQFSIALATGVFVNNKVAVGGGIGYGHSYQETVYGTGSQNSKINSINASVFVRRYVKITDSFFFSAEGKVQYGNSSTDTYQNNGGVVTTASDKYHSVNLNVTPFFIFFPSKTWAIEAGIGTVGYDSYKRDSSYKGNGFVVNFGSINLGLSYYFKRQE